MCGNRLGVARTPNKRRPHGFTQPNKTAVLKGRPFARFETAPHRFGCLAAYVSALPPLLPPGSFACSGSDGDGVPWSTPPPRCFSFIFCRNPIGRYRRLLFRCLVCLAAKECAVSTVAFLHLGLRICFGRFRVSAGWGFGFRVGNERRRRRSRRRRKKQRNKEEEESWCRCQVRETIEKSRNGARV